MAGRLFLLLLLHVPFSLLSPENVYTVFRTPSDGRAQPHLRLFGHLLDADPVRGRIAVRKGTGYIVIYDSNTGDQIEAFRFSAPLVLVRFRGDGGALLALTTKQEAITLKLS